MLRGVERLEGERGIEGREQLPIPPNFLCQIKKIWDQGPPGWIRSCCR